MAGKTTFLLASYQLRVSEDWVVGARRFEAKRLFSDLPSPDDGDARRARKATANQVLTVLKAALNRAFHADRVSSDTAWRKVKPFKRVDEAVVRCLTAVEARRLIAACARDFKVLAAAGMPQKTKKNQ